MRLSLEQAESRKPERNTNFKYINEFYLKSEGESNIVRFLFDDPTNIEIHGVHIIRLTTKNGKQIPIAVDCLGDNCPLCKEAQNHTAEKFPLVSRVRDNIYMPLIAMYDNNGEVKPSYRVFVRGINYYKDTLAPFAKRNELTEAVEIERTGQGVGTRYNLYNARKDLDGNAITDTEFGVILNKSLEELKADFEVQEDDICGRADSLIRTWTAEQIEMFLADPSKYPSLNSNTEENTEEKKEEAEEVKPRRRSSNHGF